MPPVDLRLNPADLSARACASGYNCDAKKHFMYLMHALGGSFTLAMNRQNTHLFVPCKAGAKYDTTRK